MVNFKNVGKIYFVGIGGVGMSAAAGIAKGRDYEVLGSDSKELYSPTKDVLADRKIPYFAGYDDSHIKDNQSALFVISAGEDLDNPEVKYIYDHALDHISFAELLYYLHREKLRVVVAGTHGKSTTTGLLGHLFKGVDDGTFMAGAVLQNYDSNYYVGEGHYAVFEGDEYKAEFDDPTPKFHYYKPDILVLTNLEFDHPDIFENVDAIEQEFRELIANMPPDGLIVYNGDNAILAKLAHETNISSVSFGIENETDFKIEEFETDSEFTTFEVHNKFSKQISSHLLGQTEQYKIQLPGKINMYNALAAITTLRSLGFQQEDIALDVLTYRGVKRRFETVGHKNGVTIIDDYAHHPTAVRETIEASRLRYPKATLWAVFEPHTFSRTKATLNDLVKSFDHADEVLISDIYPAREKATTASIKSDEVVTAINRQRSIANKGVTPVRLVHNTQEALDILKSETKSGDVIIIMAVGSFNKLAYELKEKL